MLGLKKKTDKELIALFKKDGNLDILGELYQRYMHLVYGVCLKYFEDRDEAKDAVNHIFEILIVDIPKYEIEKFKTWLYVVTKNYCFMELRKKKALKNRHEKYSAEFFMENTEEDHPINESPNSGVEEQLKKCIEHLKLEQKRCVYLFYYENKCYKTIAEELNINLNKVKSFIQNGKRNLKICLEKNKVENYV